METVSTKTKNSIIDEAGGSSVVVFKGSDTCSWEGVFCGIYRVKPDI